MASKLTDKENRFVAVFMDTGKKNEAYAEAFNCANQKQKTIDNSAYKLSMKPRVKGEIEARRAALAQRVQVTQVKILEGYFKLIDDYNLGIRLALSDDKKEQAAAYRIANFINSSSVVAALKAIAEMTGLTAPPSNVINEGVIINYINPK